jgi:hypothetical protein
MGNADKLIVGELYRVGPGIPRGNGGSLFFNVTNSRGTRTHWMRRFRLSTFCHTVLYCGLVGHPGAGPEELLVYKFLHEGEFLYLRDFTVDEVKIDLVSIPAGEQQ